MQVDKHTHLDTCKQIVRFKNTKTHDYQYHRIVVTCFSYLTPFCPPLMMNGTHIKWWDIH